MKNVIPEPFRDGLVEVYWANSKCGIRVKNSCCGSAPIPCLYDSYLVLTGETIAMQKNGKWGIINHKNETVCDFVYDRFNKASEETTLCMAMKNGRWGLVNSKTGAIATGFEFDDIKPINIKPKTKRPLPNEDYDNDRGDRQDYWAMYKSGKVFPYDENGNMICPSGFDNIFNLVQYGPTSKDVGFIIESNFKVGILNTLGRVIRRCDCDEIKQIESYAPYGRSFFCLVAIKRNNKWGLLDRECEVALECEFDDIKCVGSSLALKHGSKWGVMPLQMVLKQITAR